jgi:hypothetical protein
MTDEEIDAEFEHFWEIINSNENLSAGVKEVARQCYHVGVRENERKA